VEEREKIPRGENTTGNLIGAYEKHTLNCGKEK
jgi:hypothetical protein